MHSSSQKGFLLITVIGITTLLLVISFSFQAAQFGGEEKIKAFSVETPAISNSKILDVKVPELVELLSGANYNLTGQTTSHPSNHFGTQTTLNALQTIANDYTEQFPGSVLHYNDTSLSKGGLFDIGPTTGEFWNPPHSTHRLGRNVDLEIWNLSKESGKVLKEIIQDNNGAIFEESNHWHLTF